MKRDSDTPTKLDQEPGGGGRCALRSRRPGEDQRGRTPPAARSGCNHVGSYDARPNSPGREQNAARMGPITRSPGGQVPHRRPNARAIRRPGAIEYLFCC